MLLTKLIGPLHFQGCTRGQFVYRGNLEKLAIQGHP